MKLFILLLGLLIWAFFVFPNTAAAVTPVIEFLDHSDRVLYASIRGTVRQESSYYTKELCRVMGYEFIPSKNKNDTEEGVCAVVAADKGNICYSGFQCSSGVCENDSEDSWYLNFGPGSCSKFYQEDKQPQNRVRFGIKTQS